MRKGIFKILAILSFVAFTMNSCKNDIEIFTEYKEQAVVYGLLDLGEDVQYLRISRTFLNPGASASDVAKISDSLYFKSIDVKLIEEQSGQVIQLNEVDSIPKDSGFFQNQPNILFATDVPIVSGKRYRLEITNPQTGYFASARTALVERPIVQFPVSIGNPRLSVSPQLNIQLRFNNGLNAKSHDATFEFWIEESPKSDTLQKKVTKYTWRLARELKNEFTAPANRTRLTPGTNFFDFFKGVLSEDTTVRRRIIRTDFVLYSGSQDLTDFIDASKPSIGIVQKQNEFSNIENAIGIFTSRHTFRLSDIFIDDATIAFFNSLDDYKMLGIIR